MSSERAKWQSNESLPVPAYTIVELSTPTELEDAVAFDTAIFSENRRQYEGEDVAQPTVDISEYEHLVENGGRVIAFLDDTNNEMIALCTVALKNDPEALESLLQTMEPDTAYMTVAGVKKEYRGQGLGHKMLQARLEIARQAGKTKAITTVHPTNIASMKNLLKAGFLGIARIDNYYNMHDADGERFVMFHGDINNANWAEESLDHSVTLTTPYTKTAEISRLKYNAETALDFMTRESVYSLYAVEHADKKDTPTYHWVKFIGDNRPPIPSLIYPYNSFAEAYATTHNLDMSQKPYHHPISDSLAHISMRFVDLNYENYTRRYDLDSFPIMEAVTKKFFVEWVNEYRSFVQKSIDTLEPTTFAPSFDTATIMSRQVIEELVLLFIANENDNLWEHIDECLPDLRKNLTRQGVEPLYPQLSQHPHIEKMTHKDVRILYSKQNALLHQHLNAYYQDFVSTLPWPHNKEGFTKFRKRLYRLVGKRAFDSSDLHWS